MISFDKGMLLFSCYPTPFPSSSNLPLGGQWQPLTIPYDRDGTKQITCTASKCQLHLHGISKRNSGSYNSDTFGPLLSNDKAVGLWLGTGKSNNKPIFCNR